MENMNAYATLAWWRSLPEQRLAPANLQTHPALQPRDISLVPYRDRGKVESAALVHVDELRRWLARPDAELDAILAVQAEEKLYVVDGHHRLAAYKAAGRPEIPCRIAELPFREAVNISKLVNLDLTKLPLHAQQRTEALWQHLAQITLRGREKLPRGWSCRKVGSMFGLSHDTVARMLKHMDRLDIADFSSEACDPGTDFPRWKYVKGNNYRNHLDQALSPDQRLRHQAEQAAKALGKLLDRFSPEAVGLGIQLLKADEQDPDRTHQLNSLAELKELSGSGDRFDDF